MKNVILKLKALLPAKDFIITGSFVLSEYGLVSKDKVNDLDIVLVQAEQSTVETINRLMEQFPAKTKPPKIDIAIKDGEKPVKKKTTDPKSPTAIFMFDKFKIDIFLVDSDTKSTLNIDSFKYHTIDHIITSKKSYDRMKDWLQLRDIARLFFKEEEFTDKLNNSWQGLLSNKY